MPEYFAPGVFVEETSFRAKSIEGVPTGTAGFVGLARRGAAGSGASLVTSVREFERQFGSFAEFQIQPQINHLAHAVRAFFAEGGKRLWVAAVVPSGSRPARTALLVREKRARFQAAFPGSGGKGEVSVSLGAKKLTRAQISSCAEGTVLRIHRRVPEHVVKRKGRWWDAANPTRSKRPDSVSVPVDLLTLTVTTKDEDGASMVYSELGLDRAHARFIGRILSARPLTSAQEPVPWFVLESAASLSIHDWLAIASPVGNVTGVFPMGHGPGTQPGVDAVPTLDDWRAALKQLEAVEEVATLAAPGHTDFPGTAAGVTNALVAQAKDLNRFAVLDTPVGSSLEAARAFRRGVDTSYAALYYPWVVVSDPRVSGAELGLPPSGIVCGVLARVDSERGVHKAPANEAFRSALRPETSVSAAQQEVLNPEGINSLRVLPGRGFRVWGARTTSSDPEWKYVNVRRYLSFLERSIEKGTQWAVFEPNNEALWLTVRSSIETFLYSNWQEGALLGAKPEQAFFVKCDRSTMTQADMDAGRLVCLIGVAVAKPAEFVIFRIGQWTSDRK